jgi:hypothetical protein
MFRYISVEPDVTDVLNTVTSKNLILKPEFKKILDDAESQVIVTLNVGENGA